MSGKLMQFGVENNPLKYFLLDNVIETKLSLIFRNIQPKTVRLSMRPAYSPKNAPVLLSARGQKTTLRWEIHALELLNT
jgi:hypothetical protein